MDAVPGMRLSVSGARTVTHGGAPAAVAGGSPAATPDLVLEHPDEPFATC